MDGSMGRTKTSVMCTFSALEKLFMEESVNRKRQIGTNIFGLIFCKVEKQSINY